MIFFFLKGDVGFFWKGMPSSFVVFSRSIISLAFRNKNFCFKVLSVTKIYDPKVTENLTEICIREKNYLTVHSVTKILASKVYSVTKFYPSK